MHAPRGSAVGRRCRSATRLLLLALALLLSGGPALSAAQELTGPLVEATVLPNGLLVLSEQRPESRVAGLSVAVRAGARFEDDATDSAAKLLEHLYFQGTVSRPSREAILRPITSRGGSLSVSAGLELLRLESSVRAPDLDVAIDVLSDMLLNSLFAPEALEKERQIALQELDEIQDDPAGLLSWTVRDELFGEQPLGRRPIGSYEGLERLTLADLLTFRDRWVGADRTVVAVVGPFEHADVVGRIAVAFSPLPAAQAAIAPTATLEAARTGRLDVEAGSEQAGVAIAVVVPGILDADRYPLAVLQAALNGFTGRLTSEIREQRGLAYRTSASGLLTSDVGLFMVTAGTQPSTADLVLELLEFELARLRDEPMSDDELSRAIGFVRGGRLVGSESALARASDLAGERALGVDESLDDWEARVCAVTADDVRRVARAYLGPERQLQVVVRP